ncbi:uncharacterized protein si:ch211-106e7.2 isoform X1 [Girardinichthys multiradiatus]|uniref:uncharacterized protein si:ch211-106e7.2 isoform X1 n=1 Tax=Girardinichthys multiradiatus TaxID=208333 RepID=UPI001FAC7FB6|nr:uncharacterized protein si:ch211-106e7.2 isoform X1 [Girardinichthys multiradiatus]
MHSFALMKAPTRQAGPPPQALQAATNLSPGASGAWSANSMQQYMAGNTGVKLSPSANFASQNGANPSRQIANWQSSDTSHQAAQTKKASHFKDYYFLRMLLGQSQYKLNKLQNENVPVPTTCVSQTAPMQNSHQYLATQSLHGTVVTNPPYVQQNTSVFCKQPVSFNEVQTNGTKDTYSNIQQSRAMHPAVNGDMTRTISSYNPAPSLPYEQVFNANTAPSAAVHNSQTQIAPNQIHRQSFSQGGYSQNYPPSYEMATSQSFRNNSVSTQCTSANAQAINGSTTGQINWQTSAQCNPSYNNCGGFRSINSWNQYEKNSFQMNTNGRPLNYDAAPQQMLRQNVHANSISTSYTGSPNTTQHYVRMSRMSSQNIQTANLARSESYSLTASQSFPLCSGQPLPQTVMSRAQHTVNAPFQQNLPPNALSVTTAGNHGGRGQVVPINETVSNRCPVESMSNVAQGCKTMLLESNEPEAFVVSHSNNNGMPSPFKQNDMCASMSSHTSIRAVAVVPPLSQEACQSPASAEPCKSVDGADKMCISPNEATISETTCVREESNWNRVTLNKAACDDRAVLTVSDSEPESLAQTSQWDNHESVVHKVSDVSASPSGSGKQTEGTVPYSPPVHELSLIPTKSWTAEALNKLILETDKAQPKPKDTPDHSTFVKILSKLWNKDIALFFKNYESFQLDKLSDVENFCDTHIKRNTVILTQVNPDFKDQLKRYNILKDDEVYSEPPYRSLWLNVNDLLDDIDKEFGFPWTLKRHFYVDETESQGHDFQTSGNIPEQAFNETVNKVSSPAESESVEMIEESDIPRDPPASTLESSGKSSLESSYSFKIEVLPPEEAKVIFEQIQKKKQQSSNCLKETAVIGSGQREESEHMDPTINEPKGNDSLNNQLEEICCLARFVEMNLRLGKPPSHCQCRDKQNANKGTIKTLKPDPDQLSSGQDVNCQSAQSGFELSSNLCQIIDLTDDGDNQLLSFFDEEPEPIFQISACSQSNGESVTDHMDGDLSDDLTIPKEMHNHVFKRGESEEERVQEELLSAGAVQSSDSVCCTPVTNFNPSNTMERKELFPLPNQKENCNQTRVTKDKSSSEKKTQTQVTDANNQTSLSLHVNNERHVKKEKRQSSLDLYFPSLKKPKKSNFSVASEPDHTSEAQHSASEAKIAELVLFGAGQQEASAQSEKTFLVSSQTSPSYEKHRPPGVLSVKLDSLGRDTTTAATKDYSVKQLIYDKWRRSVPTVAFRHKNKLRRHTSIPASLSFGNTQEKQTISPELKLSDRTRKYILSLKKRRALTERRRHEKIKRSYSVTLPEHQQGSETQNETSDGKPVQGGIVLKFSLLPNTFDFTEGSAGMKEASEPVSDKLEPVEEKAQFPKKALTKTKAGTWYPSQAKQYEPLCVSKNVGLFQEYQKKYKEKTRKSMDE